MTFAEVLGTPVSDPTDAISATADRCPVPTPTQPSEYSERGGGNLLWTALVAATTLCVGLGIGAYVVARSGESASASPTPGGPVAVPTGVAGLAELFVASHLSGATAHKDLVALHPGATPPATASGLWINRAATIAGTAIADDTWELTVATDVLEMVDGAYEPAGIQYFTVTVAETGGQPVALSAPSRIPTPENVSRRVVAEPFTRAIPPDQEAAVTGFLDAYLTGEGEIARYLAPTARMALFPAPPYVSIEIQRTAADSFGRVRASLTATSTTGAAQALEFALEMTYESGLWEVLALLPTGTQG